MSNPPKPLFHPTPEQLAASQHAGAIILAFLFGEDNPTDFSVKATKSSDPHRSHRPEHLTVVRPKD